MGFSGISPWSLILVFLIVVLLFGTKRLKGLGGDLGSALKSFKGALNDNGGRDPDIMNTSSDNTRER